VSGDTSPVVSVVRCETYELDQIRAALQTIMAPLGGMRRFVQPGQRVLLKPNLLKPVSPERGITTHPALIQAVAEAVIEAGGTVWVGDSPGGPSARNPQLMKACGAVDAAREAGAELITFEEPVWKRVRDIDYFLAPAVVDADLVINLPKLKTHMLTGYTGAVKNLFGTIVGPRKRELHLHAPGIRAFSEVLVDVLELVQPELTILDGVLGLHGNGPGMGGKSFAYGCLAASTDPVALDTVITGAMGFRAGEILHLRQSTARGLGVSETKAVQLVGDSDALRFGRLDLPRLHWFLHVPQWAGGIVERWVKVWPVVDASACVGCGRCAEVCPKQVISNGRPPAIDLEGCIGCLCCAEICPQGAISPQRNVLAQLIGVGI
jgi:uncharacterized protein (DUF362 family)/Pyruvate/2-oxoacid:ferredoxin oxidoreductase delta subunit